MGEGLPRTKLRRSALPRQGPERGGQKSSFVWPKIIFCVAKSHLVGGQQSSFGWPTVIFWVAQSQYALQGIRFQTSNAPHLTRGKYLPIQGVLLEVPRGTLRPASRLGIESSGYRMIQGSRFRVQGSKFRVQGSWFRVHGSGFRVHGSLIRVHGAGLRVPGSGCGVEG